MTPRVEFHLESTPHAGTQARAGRLITKRSESLTPLFMPVGTHATVKGARVEDLEDVGATVLLANTYHLLLRPGPDVFKAMGGIHEFMRWSGSVLTDSGGFQIFSLPGSRRMNEDGAVFKSYVDGRDILLSPEASIQTQCAIGSDIMMVLDECVPSTVERSVALTAMERTHRWALRSLAARGDAPGAMFGIVQGACFEDLRRESAAFLSAQPFDGFAIGGLAVGETKAEREDFTELTAALLPRDRPRYLMGVGTPIDLLEAVHRGVDMFDCIIPTAHAQHGMAFTFDGIVRLRRSAYRLSTDPISPGCTCYACGKYTRAYIHHLIKAHEGLGWRLIGHHNLHFYQQLMRDMRTHILAGTFPIRYRELQEALVRSDTEPQPVVAKVRRPRGPSTLGRFEVRTGDDGTARIALQNAGEAMHPASSPDDEAHGLYVEKSRLIAKLSAPGAETLPPLVIWDVGLGAGHNAMATVRAIEALAVQGPVRPVHMVSFENDLDAFELALKNQGRFVHLRHSAPTAVLKNRTYTAPHAPFTWQLIEGDFLKTYVDAPAPDVVFFDPFSYKTDAEMWRDTSFAKIFAAAKDRAMELYTYSTSTASRAAMLAAGFFVAKAPGVGARSECTVALTPKAWATLDLPANGLEALGDAWFSRWTRSHARHPHGTDPADYATIEARIKAHEQFRDSSLA